MLQNLKNFYHLLQSVLANIIYDFPSRKLKVIGVTGTDGKTTTTHLIYHILKSTGKKVSMVSSVYANIAGKTYDIGFHVTTPDVFPLQKYLKQSVQAGDEFFILETTSHALAQNRSSMVRYEVGVITNVTHEHLDWHKTYENYAKAKLILLKNAKTAILNIDDKSYPILNKLLAKNFFTYGLINKADFNIDISKKLNLNLPRFNNYNYLAAYSVCRTLNIPEKVILKAFKTFELPKGRLEVVSEKPIKVIIDFAHTPNALHEILSEVKEEYRTAKNRLIHVFGSAGKRDFSKRPYMGEESGTYSDIIILTEEDYRDESPQLIARQIAAGMETKGFKLIDSVESGGWDRKKYAVILDRKMAIEKAVEIARPGDVLVLTGKSHEKSLCRGRTEFPWSEHEAVKAALQKKSK